MKNLPVILFAVFMPLGVSPFVLAQDHAPTVQQCTADSRLWMSQMTEYNNAEAARLTQGRPNKTEIMMSSFRLLAARARELVQCQAVDPDRQNYYDQVNTQILDAVHNRYVMFVERHHLTAEMIKEDDDGIR